MTRSTTPNVVASGDRRSNRHLLEKSNLIEAAAGPHGNGGLYGTYGQDHIPVVQQKEAVGHSVRAAYLYTGMADVAALTGNMEYVRAIDTIWNDVVGTKLYVTGSAPPGGTRDSAAATSCPT